MAKKTSRTKAKGRKPARPAMKTPARKAAARRPARKAAPVMDHDAMMAAWQRSMTPGPGHQRLEPMVGTFRATVTFVMGPGAPPQVSDGMSENRWVLDGRFLEQKYRGTSMGMPFEGLGYTGFDNIQGKYVGSWMDTFGTGVMSSIGVGKPDDMGFDCEATAFDPTGKRVLFWCRVAIQDHDHHTWEMWTKAPNGKRYRTMLAEYTRQ